MPSGDTKFSAVDASVNVAQEATRTRVRISLVSRVSEKNGNVRSVTPIDDPVVYQALLARIDRAV